MRIADMPARWVEVLAELLSDLLAPWRARRSITVTQEGGRFVVHRSIGGREEVVTETEIGMPLQPKTAQALQNHFIVFELLPDRVVSRHLSIPAQAREFVAGIVGNQIERLSPWRPQQAFYGFDVKPDPTDSKNLDVHVFIAARANIDAVRDRLTQSNLAPSRICVRTEAGKKGALVALWNSVTNVAQGGFANLPAIIGASLAAVVVISAAVSIWASIATSMIRDETDEVSTRAQQLQKQSLASRRGPDLTLLSPVERAWALKESAPAAVLVLEALSKALPDSAYLTEFHLENATMRVTGLTNDAPSLIAALEQSGRFSGVHFFAPTAKGTDSALYRFNIEGQVDAPVELVGN